MSMKPGDGALGWEGRFWRRVRKTDGCWLWLGGRGGTTRQPYGVYMLPGQVRRGAHVIAYELLREPVAGGYEIDHLCSNSLCVNPDHLEVVTRAENRRRQWQRQTHCKRGHERSPQNTYDYNGHRYCRPCRDIAKRRYRERRAACL